MVSNAAAAARAGRALTGLWPWAAVIVVLALPGAFAATNHVVGDGTGWRIPSNTSFYGDWASRQTFAVGDTLQFNFATGAHNVIKVPKSSYDNCSTDNQIGNTESTGPATVALNSSGTHYYLCSVGSHCSSGQKVAITVNGTANPSSPPTAGGPVPPTAGVPVPPTAGGPVPPATPPKSSASVSAPGSRVAVGFALAAASSLLWIL